MSTPDIRSAPLHCKSTGRSTLARLRLNAQKRAALKLLKKLSKEHLANERRQLAVFAYDLIGHRINLDGVYEGENLDLLFDWLAPAFRARLADSCAIDIGANIGNHSLYFSPHFRRVISFEPNPRTFRLLSLNASLVDNVTCHNAAISDSDRDGLLDVRQHNTGVSKVAEQATADTVPVALKRLDTFLDAAERVSLVKIDVEGHEEQVLLGSGAVIRQNRPLVIFEQHKDDFANGTSRPIEILKGYGYTRFAVVEEFPPKLYFLPRPVRRLCQSLLRLFVGERRSIVLRTHFEPQFHPFIIAVPDWALPPA